MNSIFLFLSSVGLPLASNDSAHDRAIAAAIGCSAFEAQVLLSQILYGARLTGVAKRVNDKELVVEGRFIHPFLKIEAEGKYCLSPSDAMKRGSFGQDQVGYHHSFSYRFSDIKAGDSLDIRFNRYDKENVAQAISILKRPGGRVPPCPDTKADAEHLKLFGFRWHEWRNAYWDLEEKGIAYPEHFGEHRRFPVAPAPRSAPRGG